MLLKLIALSVVFGLVVAEPVDQQVREERHVSTVDDVIYSIATKPDLFSVILNIITTVIGYKALSKQYAFYKVSDPSALSIAVDVIDWLVSHAVIIIVGGISALALCKFTDKCSPLDTIEEFMPLTPLRELVTPERLESAEKFLASAVAKYAEEKRETI